MMDIKTPEFANETEEANWWFDNQDVIADAFAEERGAKFILPDATDVELANTMAKRAGLSTEDYLNQLVHRALLTEAA